MLLSEDELASMQKRFPYPRFSKAEYERRYANIRKMMREQRLDCMLIVGGSAAYGRLWFNFRYVTNMMGKAEMANYCFFPQGRRSGGGDAAGPFARRRHAGAHGGAQCHRRQAERARRHRQRDQRARL